MKVKLLFLSILALTTSLGESIELQNRPILEKKYIQTEDIRAIIFNAIDGMNLYSQL